MRKMSPGLDFFPVSCYVKPEKYILSGPQGLKPLGQRVKKWNYLLRSSLCTKVRPYLGHANLIRTIQMLELFDLTKLAHNRGILLYKILKVVHMLQLNVK